MILPCLHTAGEPARLAVRALGGRRWRLLHRAVYLVAVLAIVHFFWMRAGKHDYTEVAVYGAIVAALLGGRVWHRIHSVRPAALPPG